MKDMKIYVKSSTSQDESVTFEFSPFEIKTDETGHVKNIRDFKEHVVDPYTDIDDISTGLYLMDGEEAGELFEETFMDTYGYALKPNSSYTVSGMFTIYYTYEYDPEFEVVESGSEEVVECKVSCRIVER